MIDFGIVTILFFRNILSLSGAVEVSMIRVQHDSVDC